MIQAELSNAALHHNHTAKILSAAGLALMGLTLFFVIAALALTVRNGYALLEQSFLVSVAIAALVAGLITYRRSHHPVGWLIAGFAFCFALGELSRQYVIYGAFRQPGVLPALSLMAIPVYFVWFPGLILVMVFLPLYFPNGQLASPRWRPFAWLSTVILVLVTLLAAVRPRADEIPGYPNPLGNALLIAPPEIINTLFNFLQLSWVLLGIVSAAGLFLRFRRASKQQRAQIEWFLYALAAMLVSGAIGQTPLLGFLPPAVNAALFAALLAFLWISIAVAILRYRLFDIDLIIRRTLTYALVALALGIVYYGTVLLLQRLLAMLTGAQSEIITVLSTLAIAALFVPLRDRVQKAIDKRFYRNRYDAQQVLTAFAMTVRDETNLEKLTGELVRVIQETMQPAGVSVWLRETNETRRRPAPDKQSESNPL